MITVTEGSLALDFDDHFQVVRWDRARPFREGLAKMPTTRAVDICVTAPDFGAAFIEITNYGSTRFSTDSLCREVAEKVRDTLAAMVWSCERGISDRSHEPLVRAFLECATRQRLHVVVWLEADRPPDAARAAPLQQEIRGKVKRWCPATVRVTNRVIQADGSRAIPWLRHRSLAR